MNQSASKPLRSVSAIGIRQQIEPVVVTLTVWQCVTWFPVCRTLATALEVVDQGWRLPE
jgi:hypothetical protein